MAIYRLMQFSAFEPDQIACMKAAYEDALKALQVTRRNPITDLLAKKIVEAAQTGERDPVRLREAALRDLGLSPGQPSDGFRPGGEGENLPADHE